MFTFGYVNRIIFPQCCWVHGKLLENSIQHMLKYKYTQISKKENKKIKHIHSQKSDKKNKKIKTGKDQPHLLVFGKWKEWETISISQIGNKFKVFKYQVLTIVWETSALAIVSICINTCTNIAEQLDSFFKIFLNIPNFQ